MKIHAASLFHASLLCIVAICSSNARGDVVQIMSSDVIQQGQVQRSTVSTRVEVEEQKGADDDVIYQPIVTVTVNGQEVGKLLGAETGYQPSAVVQIVELDRSNPYPEILFSSFTFGAHCCSEVKVLTSDPSGKVWSEVDVGAFDGDSIQATDPAGNGNYVIHSYDNRFLYRFGCYACGEAPSRIFALQGSELIDVTRQADYLPIHRDNLRAMEDWFNQPEKDEPNAFLAAHVANKALVGELADGWKTMLKYYDRDSDWGLRECEAGYDENGKCKGEEIVFDFPTALKMFLTETGYMSKFDTVN